MGFPRIELQEIEPCFVMGYLSGKVQQILMYWAKPSQRLLIPINIALCTHCLCYDIFLVGNGVDILQTCQQQTQMSKTMCHRHQPFLPPSHNLEACCGH